MYIFVTFALVLQLAISAFAQESDVSDGPPARENIFVKLLPHCKVFVNAMENKISELMDKEEIGRYSCKDPDYPKVCLKDDALKTRCAVSEMPSEECMAQLTDFMQGGICNLNRK